MRLVSSLSHASESKLLEGGIIMIKKISYCIYFFLICGSASPHDYTVTLIQGSATAELVPFMVEQSIQAFSGYPYLCKADRQEERILFEYLSSLNHRAVVVAYYKGEPVGFLAGVPHRDYFSDSCLLKQAGYYPDEWYYFSEVIIMPDHQKKGLLNRFFTLLEEFAVHKGYRAVSLLCESHLQHSLKPLSYKELGPMWSSLGYKPLPYFQVHTWETFQDDGTSLLQDHRLDYWVKFFRE